MLKTNRPIINWMFRVWPNFPFPHDSWTKVVDATTSFLTAWKSPTYNKVLGHKLPESLDVNKTTVIGGICSIFTAESEQIRKKERTFKNIADFEKWIYSWYPRIDQIHDTVGIPPKLCRGIVYVCEDSLFAKRLATHTGLPKHDLQRILKEVHETQGHVVVRNWCQAFGYTKNIDVVYTSDLEKELKIGLRCWERLLGQQFQNRHQEFAYMKLMYTALWLDILEINNFGVIYEPCNHMYQSEGLKNWSINNKFGEGFNSNLGIMGYLPFWSAKGLSRILPLEQVPNYGNFSTYDLSMDQIPWYVINFLFANKDVLTQNPTVISYDKANHLIKAIIRQCYSYSKGAVR